MLLNLHNTTVWHQDLFLMMYWMAFWATHYTLLKEKSGLICQLTTYWLISNWGLPPFHTSYLTLYPDLTHSDGLQHTPSGPLWISATTDPLQLYGHCFNHTRCWLNKPSRNWPLEIISNYLQLRPSLLPSFRWQSFAMEGRWWRRAWKGHA